MQKTQHSLYSLCKVFFKYKKGAKDSVYTSSFTRMCSKKWESTLNSRILANHFKELCKSFLPPYREANMWVNRQKIESNNNIICFLTHTVRLIKEDRIDYETFKREIKKIKDLNILQVELLWYLEFFRIMSIVEFIHCNNNERVLRHIAQQIFESLLDYTGSSEVRKKMLYYYLKTILECLKNDSENGVTFYQIQLNLIEGNLKQYYNSEENGDVEKYLDISHVTELFHNSEFDHGLIRLFFQHILMALLVNSQQKMRSIFKKQEKMKNNVVDKKIWQFFVTMSEYCDVDFMMHQLQTLLLETSKEIDWDHMFCFISFVGKYYKNGWIKLKMLTNLIIKVAFQNLNSKLLSHVFLIARQGCFERGNDSFPSYLQWFSSTFSSDSKNPVNSEKICTFFFDFLTSLLPFEPTYYSKVHVNKAPSVPASCQSILQEYTELVKAHLNSLNVSVEFGICENTTSKSAAAFDVENVIKYFERTNDILSSVFQASLFCKEYYEKKFLVELLSKFEGKKSVRHKFILKLQSLGKIPNSLFKGYKSLEKQAK